MTYPPQRALELLRLATGQREASFRDGQEDAIQHLVEGRGRLLVVQKTGWGKSAVYFITAKLLREAGRGPTLLVSPLLALMRNQIQAAERMGVRSVRITSDNRSEWEECVRALNRDKVDILLVAPERLANEEFRQDVLVKIAPRVPMLVIDEAHCMSDWGHDFRPDYQRIIRIARLLPPNARILGTTATANDRVMSDLGQVLGSDLKVMRGDLNRPSLKLQTIRLPTQAERLAWLAANVPRIEGHGIIYTLTVHDAERVAEWLQQRGIDVEAYTGQSGEERPELEQALLHNEVKALVATTALGMGFDKPDLGFVIHFQAPGSAIAYYQQVGRAGRALTAAYGVLLSGKEETDVVEYFIGTAFPTPDDVSEIIGALDDAPGGLSVPQLLAEVNVSRGRIEKALKLLALESPAPVVKVGTKWNLTAAALRDEFWERTKRLTRLRKAELAQMQEYAGLESGHMRFLIEALDGDAGACEEPDLPDIPADVSTELVGEAVRFLKQRSLSIEPRKRWPLGRLSRYRVGGSIAPELQMECGMALSSWGDAGWGGLVKQGKYADGRFADDLVEACYKLVQSWSPKPAPKWVTCIPSDSAPNLVPDFAGRLARRLGLPFRLSLQKSRTTAQQRTMQNSAQQALNLDGALSVVLRPVPTGPVLLVDDMVDSKWTFTIAAWLLRSKGCGPVWPLALASSGSW